MAGTSRTLELGVRGEPSVLSCLFRDLGEQEFSHRVGVIPTGGPLKEKAKAGHTGLRAAGAPGSVESLVEGCF